jgi:hypothetical protein
VIEEVSKYSFRNISNILVCCAGVNYSNETLLSVLEAEILRRTCNLIEKKTSKDGFSAITELETPSDEPEYYIPETSTDS